MSQTVFATPLDTLGLIEASAGTGKTYALAGLFARAVIVERRAVAQVLAVTYTVAATQELHERVRDRLLRAAELAARWPEYADPRDPPAHDGAAAGLAMLRELVQAALADGRETLPALRRRLARAAREMDQAVITTIHGFCQRVLAEHALETAQPLQPAELVTRLRPMREAMARELWRAWSADREDGAWLRGVAGTPAGLADALSSLLAPEPLRPPAPDDARSRRDAAWAALHAAHRTHGAAAFAAIDDAVAARVLSSDRKKTVPVAVLRDWFAAQSTEPPLPPPLPLERLTNAYLRSICGKNKEDRCPASPLFDAVERYLQASEALDLHRLHALRAQAVQRDRARKQALQQRDFDDLIGAMHAAATDPVHGPRLCAAVRGQFPLALVDEFQDTDARQWTIFRALFGDGGLLLVGDPKQAIYRFRGGDVHTYQQARAQSRLAPPLERNYRSRPAVLAAVNALFSQPHLDADALGDGIAFTATAPGGPVADDAFVIDGKPAPPLIVHEVPGHEGRNWNKPLSLAHASRWCAQAIRDLLHRAADGRVQRRDGGRLRAVEPRDCAVLVRTHEEAVAVRTALAQLGVPAVAAGRRSLFETTQAQELLTLLLALATPGDERRLRAALATRLLGHDARQLERLASDGEAMQAVQRDFALWRLRWEHHGPQAMLTDVLAGQGARLLAEFDGERQLTTLLQLGELLQEARGRRLGPQGQLDWLRAAIAHADRDDETQQPRLESDASRVQILTLHGSKGLEFPLVFLPFAAIGRSPRPPAQALFHEGDVRVRQWPTRFDHPGALAWPDACARHAQEERGEDMRLLYVGLTRARDAVWICGGALSNHEHSAMDRLFAGMRPSAELRERLGPALAFSRGLPDENDRARLPAGAPPEIPPPRRATRALQRDWWIHSFSQLHRQRPHGAHALVEETPAIDERSPAAALLAGDPLVEPPVNPLVAPPVDPRFRGERFGNAVHHALEHADFAQWREHAGATPPARQRQVLIEALQSQGYADGDHADGVRELARLVAATLNAPLPEGGHLCELAPTARVPEIEFHFTLADADGTALLALLKRHGIAQDRGGFGAWPRLCGLMTGKIDLTYRNAGRVYILDYKSNVLPDYDQATMEHAMRASEYDLQALLYVVALHRWLRLRRGPAYDYHRDVGGVRYLFCRGLRHDDPLRGMMQLDFDPALVEAVDALLAGQGAAA